MTDEQPVIFRSTIKDTEISWQYDEAQKRWVMIGEGETGRWEFDPAAAYKGPMTFTLFVAVFALGMVAGVLLDTIARLL